MQLYAIAPDGFSKLTAAPLQVPAAGFLWLSVDRGELAENHEELQAQLVRWTSEPLVDLHISDLLNHQLPSHYDSTSGYDLLVFRRLAPFDNTGTAAAGASAGQVAATRQLLDAINTHPVGFGVFDRVLITVHPPGCSLREFFVQRMVDLKSAGGARSMARLPTSPAELMLRMVNQMVDGYLELRRLLTRELGKLQRALLDPKSRFQDWQFLLDSRNALHELEDTCDDQRSAVQEWLNAVEEWPAQTAVLQERDRELLLVHTRDVLEHIERVLGHVRRLEQSAEVAIQMHFSALANRTNDVMRTLTVLTAVFLPLNLITGFFGMNFDGLPLIHSETGVWIAALMMLIIAAVLGGFFWRRRYLDSMRKR